MGPKKQEPESSASPKGKETASEPADEADEAGSGNAPPASEGAAASSGASVEASEPEMTKSAKKRQRKAEAKAAMRGMKTLIGDVKQGLAEKKQREAAHEGDVTPTEPEQETAPEAVTPAVPKDWSPKPDEEERAASPPRTSPDEKRKRLGESTSRNPYATATESAAASALLSEAHAAYAERRVADAARLYEGAAAENGAGYAPLMALRAHEGDAVGALAALRSAAAVPGAATFAAQETRDMAYALGRLFVTSAAARAGASRESRAAHISFPTPDGWFEPGRREENVAPLAARRLIADARPAMACGLTLRGLDPDRFGDETNPQKSSASASSAMAAAEALRVARPDTKGWRLAARLLAAAGRALSGADASAAKACLMASAGVVAGGIGTAVPDPLEAVAESEWALASDETPGRTDETLAEEARGVVVAAAAETCADRVVAAVAARVPSAQSLERHRFDADPDADAFGGLLRTSSRPPAALVSALRALVGCVSATGASGAEAAHGALYRAADAVWALECLETYERKKAAHAKGATEISESELGAAAAVLASAAAPSNAFGWDPHVVLAFCANTCASMASPAPELADALLSTLETLRGKAAEAVKRHTDNPDKPLGTDGGALLFAAERRRSRFIAGVVDAARIAAEGGASAASAAVAACPSAAFGDAIASVAGRAARDSLAVGAETPPGVSAREWWAANHAEAVLDPFDEHVSPDGVPGGRARDPLPRLLGLEPEPKRAPPRAMRVSLDDGKLPGSTAGSRFTTPTKLATPDARARVEARVREAASAAKVSSPGVGSALKRRFAAASAPPTPLDAAATSIRKEAASLRVSLTNAARADAEATRATFEAARERLLRASRESASSAYERLDASGARGDAEDGAGDADDADFFETTAELDDDASEFVSAPSTPSAIARAFEWKGVTEKDVGAPDEVFHQKKANAGAANDVAASTAQKGALESAVGGLLATLSDDASASDPGEDADAHLDAFFAARAAEEDSDGEADGGEGVVDAVVPEADEGRGRGGKSPEKLFREKKAPGDPEGLRAVEAATRAAREASAAAKAAATTRNENMTSEAREARDAAVAAAVVRTAEASARARARARCRAAQAAQAVADAASLANLKTLRRAKRPAPRGSGGPDPAPATATSGRSGVSFAEDSARDPERAARIAKSSAMTGMPARLLSRVTQLVTPFERVAEDQATHLRLFSRDAQRAKAAAAARVDSCDVEGTTAAKPGESWVMDANDALTAWAAASALEEASAASQARLTRALAEASEEQLRALENAARAARGAAPAADAAAATFLPKAAAGKRAFRSETSAREKEKENETSSTFSGVAIVAEEGTEFQESRSRKKPNAKNVADEDKARAPPFSVDAALARFDFGSRARASAPIRDDAFLVAAESAAAEAARLGPSARELYYASYKAAMEEATASLNRSDASAVLAAAAGAARSVRAKTEDVSSSASRRVEPSPNPARRRADAALARRRANAAGARDDVGKRGTQRGGPPFANERDGVSASSRDLYARGFGGADRTLVDARSPGKRSTDTAIYAADARSPHHQTASAPNTLPEQLPPDPFEPLLKWTQKEGGRALARLWDAELSALAAAGDGKRAETDSAMRRVDAASFASRELLPLTAKGTASLAYLDACLAVDAPGERDPLTLTAFVRALRDSARATAAALLGESRGGVEARSGGGGGPLAGATARSHESAIARVAELVDAAVGTLKRRFQREGNAHGGVDPVTLTRFLADASVAPGDARAALAELRVWEGFPLDVRFARFRQAMRPRSVRLAERNAKRADSSGTAPGTDHEEPSLAFDPAIEAELASAREDRIRLAAEGQKQTNVASAFAPGKALQRSPVKRDVFAKSPSKAITRNIAASPSTPTSAAARKNINTRPIAYRTPEKEKSPGAPKTRGSGGRFGATVGSKSATRSASPFSAAGERAATRATAELAAALEASPAGDDGELPLAINFANSGSSGLSHRRRLDVSRSTEKLTAPRRPSSPATLRVVRAAAEAKESFRNINETLSQLEANAERFENDLLRSSATMAAMDAARREREDAATAALLRCARDARARAEAEDKAEMEARLVVAKRQSKK